MKHVGEGILGVAVDELGEDYIDEMDRYLYTLENFHQKTIHMLIRIVNWPILSFFLTFRWKSIRKMSQAQKTSYLLKWKHSFIPNLRTGYTVLQSIVGYGYYVLESTKKEIGYLGHTIGREHETPTLLQGKEPWVRES